LFSDITEVNLKGHHTVEPAEDPQTALAGRLRGLRKARGITQGQLAKALGRGKQLSTALISSWENLVNPVTPPLAHLEAYALFFATEQSVQRGLIDPAELTPTERAVRGQLLDELTALRDAAMTGTATASQPIQESLWHFPVDQDVTIVCAPRPDAELRGASYANPTDPDYERLSHYADLDALIELFGYICAVNPKNKVKYRKSNEMRADDYTAHLVLIGGVDWNEATRDMFRRVQIPVSQTTRDRVDKYGEFTVEQENEEKRSFKPKLVEDGEDRVLVEDVAHFYHGPNPYNRKRTVTFLNGMFSRGTHGVVLALTDARFRDRNEAYLRERFGRSDSFSVLTRVPIVNGRAVTPDWTVPYNRLHEWPGGGSAGSQESVGNANPDNLTQPPRFASETAAINLA
jgi:transcriptional regulator with XRE-family HTH domain